MRIKKIISTQIDIDNMSHLYNPDLEQIIHSKLEDKYVGKCHFSCLILKVERIINMSNRRINPLSDKANGYVNVEFEVEGISMSKNECFVAEIVEIDKNDYINLRTSDGNIVAMIHRSKMIQGARVGQMIPIRVLHQKYSINKSSISIVGEFYLIPQDDSYVFKIGKLSDDEKEELEPILEEISDLEKQVKKLDTKKKKFFNDLLFPFDKKPKIKGISSDMSKLKASGYVTRSAKTNKLDPTIHTVDKPKEYQKAPAIAVYQLFFNDYKLHMLMLIELCKTYDADLKKSHSNIWKIYKSYKSSK